MSSTGSVFVLYCVYTSFSFALMHHLKWKLCHASWYCEGQILQLPQVFPMWVFLILVCLLKRKYTLCWWWGVRVGWNLDQNLSRYSPSWISFKGQLPQIYIYKQQIRHIKQIFVLIIFVTETESVTCAKNNGYN